MDFDLTGSIAEATAPLSTDLAESSLTDTIGSSAIDTVLSTVINLPNLLLGLIGQFGADLGSTGFINMPDA